MSDQDISDLIEQADKQSKEFEKIYFFGGIILVILGFLILMMISLYFKLK